MSGKIFLNDSDIGYENGSYPTDEELETVVALTLRKGRQHITFLRPNTEQFAKTPDILWNKLKWEIKRPHGRGKYTLQHAFKAAVLQSENVIFDLRDLKKIPPENAVRKLEKEFNVSRKARRMIILTKSHKQLDFKK
ncbi:MAG: hypothetical protein LBM73_00120 [Candidatus Nomurabacteria bacterium]|nr:hypothetical protein [Candidatus Nomurabacteria bacterium]